MPQRLPDNGSFNYCNIKPGAIPSAWHADLDIQLSIQVEGCLRRIQGNENAFQPTLIILSRADNFHKTQNRTVTVSIPWFWRSYSWRKCVGHWNLGNLSIALSTSAKKQSPSMGTKLQHAKKCTRFRMAHKCDGDGVRSNADEA